MRRIFNISVIAIVSVWLCGCYTNTPIMPNSNSITLALGSTDARTSLGDLDEKNKRKIFWSEGDCVALNGQTSLSGQIDDENRGVAIFSFVNRIEYPYSILYPAEFYKDATTITLPKKQAYTVGSFATNTAPMATYASDEIPIPTLHHLTGIIKLSIRQSTNEDFAKHLLHSIEYVRFEGNDGEQMWGDFTIDYASATISPIETTTDTKKVYAMVESDIEEGEVMEVFIVVPARKYEKGFTVRIMDSENHFMKLRKESAFELSKGEIYSLPEVAFEPKFTTIDVDIN